MAVTIDNIPVYEAVLGEGCGMIRISLVDEPAVMKDFVAMKDHRTGMLFAIEDEDKRLVRGVIMRADFPIYRRSEELGEYYIIYRADTIREMAQKYLAEDRANLVDLMHDGKDVEGVEMVQFFLKDSAAGIAPEGFDDVADGSLFAEFHVTDDDVWASVKDGSYRGFSLEGLFGLTPVPDAEESDIDRIVRGLNGLFEIIEKHSMNKIAKLKAALAKILVALRNVTTDKGVIYWDGDEDLKKGDTVYTGEGADRIPAIAGDYKTEDGKTIRVGEDGDVIEIVDADAEVEGNAPEEGNQENGEEVNARREEFLVEVRLRDESYGDKTRRIHDAIVSTFFPGGVYGYVAEAGDDFAVFVFWVHEADHDVAYRYEITWDAEGNAIAANPVEVHLAWVPVEEPAPFVSEEEAAQLRSQLDAAIAERDALADQVEQLKKTPAAPSAHSAFAGANGEVKTGHKGLDNIARLMKA